jgi:hypothetical protein
VKTLKALITWDSKTGKTLKREPVEVYIAWAHKPPVLTIDFPVKKGDRTCRSIQVGWKTFRSALGFPERGTLKRGR